MIMAYIFNLWNHFLMIYSGKRGDNCHNCICQLHLIREQVNGKLWAPFGIFPRGFSLSQVHVEIHFIQKKRCQTHTVSFYGSYLKTLIKTSVRIVDLFSRPDGNWHWHNSSGHVLIEHVLHLKLWMTI